MESDLILPNVGGCDRVGYPNLGGGTLCTMGGTDGGTSTLFMFIERWNDE